VSSYSLTHHNGNDWSRLKPDIVVYDKSNVVTVMDAKWKLLDASLNTTKHKYNLSQSDLYQLFAYGEKYLKGQGDLYLIYPKHIGFIEPLANFEFKPGLRLNVVPYDLETDECLLVSLKEPFSVVV
jgi:5-methylcytosine-specific restriction enzyme subunit McrC